jgi:benzoyl-CoA reductase/2-hydroxyglutaryl-CoA dehydratase subunit BcrC/BadD/HgdB
VAKHQELAREWRAQGVIYQSIKFCDLHGGVFPIIRDGFQEIGLPVLSLQREYGMTGLGQMKTRVQAFYENLAEAII